MPQNRLFARALAPTLLLPLCMAGCANQINNTFVDSGAQMRAEMTTASAEGYHSAAKPPAQDRRQWQASDVQYHTTKVTHWPSWFEDPFVDKGNDASDPNDRDAADTQFASNLIDDLAGLYGPVRFFINGIGWPVSAIVTLPGTVMASDGRLSRGLLGYDHDAERAAPGAEPPFEVRFGPMTAQPPVAGDASAPPGAGAANDPGVAPTPAPGTVEALPVGDGGMGDGRNMPVGSSPGSGQMQPAR